MYLHEDKLVIAEMVAAANASSGIEQTYIYKDYFVCMALREIVAEYPAFIFKGGTALSKCYGLINRFSEDVDLGLEALRPTEGMRKKTKSAIQTAMDKLGLSIANIEETRSRRSFNQYKVPLPEFIPHLQSDTLIIESGLMTPATPFQHGQVISFIGEMLLSQSRQDVIEQYNLESFDINVVSLERTFVDKIFAVADYHLNRDPLIRHSRHVYDLYKLGQALSFDAHLAELMKQVRSEREGGTKCISASPEVVLPVVLQEICDKQIYREDYNAVTRPLLYDDIDYETAASVFPRIISFLNEYPQ